MELQKLIDQSGVETGGMLMSPYSNHLDISYSIDQIKGIAPEGKEAEKKPRKKAEPKEKFTTDHLIQNKGIPLLIKKGRQLYFRDTKSIVVFYVIEVNLLAEEIRSNNDDVSRMGEKRLRSYSL